MVKKKKFEGLKDMLSQQPEEQSEKQQTSTPFSIPSKKISANSIDKADKGVFRKTFLMETDVADKIKAWAWYNQSNDITEKEIANEAFTDYFRKQDQKELQTAINLFNKIGRKNKRG